MIIQSHRVHVGEASHEEIVVTMLHGATVLYVHHYGLPHGYVEIVEMHEDAHSGETEERRFTVVDSYCCSRVAIPQHHLRFISVLAFDNHVWSFFEVTG